MKFFGEVGFWEGDVETEPGVFVPQIVERHYTGDIFRNSLRFQPAEQRLNDNLTISNQISILSDLYMLKSIQSIRYVKWNGVAWKIKAVTISHPRVTLELGDPYLTIGGDQNGEA